MFIVQHTTRWCHRASGTRRTGPETDTARKPACSRVRTAADEGCSGGGNGSVVFRLSWRRRLSWAAAAETTAFLAAAAAVAFLAPGGLASVVLLVGCAEPVIGLIILAAGAGVAAGVGVAGVAGVALAAGASALAVLDVAVASLGGGARAGMLQEAKIFCINTLVSNRTRYRKSIAKELTKDPIQRLLPMGCAFQRRNHKIKLQNDMRHYRKSKAGCCNNLFAIFHFTRLAKGLYKPGAKIIAMDNGGLA